jgi:hypothetical protein
MNMDESSRDGYCFRLIMQGIGKLKFICMVDHLHLMKNKIDYCLAI